MKGEQVGRHSVCSICFFVRKERDCAFIFQDWRCRYLTNLRFSYFCDFIRQKGIPLFHNKIFLRALVKRLKEPPVYLHDIYYLRLY